MKLLTFQAKRFRWQSYSKTLEDAQEERVEDEVAEAVVVFVHAEAKDEPDEERRRVFKHTLKHVKWLANKRGLTNVVLHSFTHLGGDNADPDFAQALLEELDERLTQTGYDVRRTPFGWFCEWDLSVYGESLAKVWKEV
ncbi:MAG: threonyl-tRNA synthetase editing domain-containing protein [Planctomycetota bacterium]